MLQRILANGLQVLLVLFLLSLVSGTLNRLKEIVQSKRDPIIVHPYRDLWKLFHKDQVLSDRGSSGCGLPHHYRTAVAAGSRRSDTL